VSSETARAGHLYAISQDDLAHIRLALGTRAARLVRQSRSRRLAGPVNAALRRPYRDEASRCQQIARELACLEPGTPIEIAAARHGDEPGPATAGKTARRA
jgi:hypothetical protein